MALLASPLFVEAVVREQVNFCGNGLLDEPANWTQLVRYAHGELEAFQSTAAQAEAKKKRPTK